MSDIEKLPLYFKIFENGKPTGYIVTEENLRSVFTDIDFDSGVDPKIFESRGFAVIETTGMPDITPYQTVTDLDLETRNEDGTWRQNWQINDVSEEDRKKIFDAQLKIIVDSQNIMLDSLNEQLINPTSPEESIETQKWIDAIKSMDISDPFDVIWPTESTFITLNS